MKHDEAVRMDRTQLIEKTLPLVGWTVRRYFKPRENVVGMSYEDLFQEGCVGLCRAASAYDTSRSTFDTYAVAVIRNHLIDYCRALTAPTRMAPTASLEQLAETDWESSDTESGVGAYRESGDDSLSTLTAKDFLRTWKCRYAGSARLGMEALELKVLGGYGVTEIARHYGVKPNLVGAWMSRAKKRIRTEITEEELDALGVEKAS